MGYLLKPMNSEMVILHLAHPDEVFHICSHWHTRESLTKPTDQEPHRRSRKIKLRMAAALVFLTSEVFSRLE